MAKIELEIGGKYTAQQSFDQLMQNIGKAQGGTKVLADAAQRGFSQIGSSALAQVPAIGVLQSAVNGFAQGGWVGMIAGGVISLSKIVVDGYKKMEEAAKKAVENLVESVKNAYSAARRQETLAVNDIQLKADDRLDQLQRELAGVVESGASEMRKISGKAAEAINSLTIESVDRQNKIREEYARKIASAETTAQANRLQAEMDVLLKKVQADEACAKEKVKAAELQARITAQQQLDAKKASLQEAILREERSQAADVMKQSTRRLEAAQSGYDKITKEIESTTSRMDGLKKTLESITYTTQADYTTAQVIRDQIAAAEKKLADLKEKRSNWERTELADATQAWERTKLAQTKKQRELDELDTKNKEASAELTAATQAQADHTAKSTVDKKKRDAQLAEAEAALEEARKREAEESKNAAEAQKKLSEANTSELQQKQNLLQTLGQTIADYKKFIDSKANDLTAEQLVKLRAEYKDLQEAIQKYGAESKEAADAQKKLNDTMQSTQTALDDYKNALENANVASGLSNSNSLVSQQSQSAVSSNPGRKTYDIRRQNRDNQRAIRDQVSALRTDSGIQSAMRQMGSISKKTQQEGLANLADTAAALYREGWSAEAIEQALIDAASRYMNKEDILEAMEEAGLIGGGGGGGSANIPDPTTSLNNITTRLESIKSTLEKLGAK